MNNQKTSALIFHLKTDLQALHDDWETLKHQRIMLADSKFLEKIALHIKKLDSNATLAYESSKLKKTAKIVHYALSTPWGAPFIGKTTLLDAANNYKPENTKSSLMYLLSDCLTYGQHKQVPLFNVLDDISEQLDHAN